MENLLILVIVAAIIGFAARYIYKEKKRGVKCIGCPDGCSCASGGCGGCSGNCGGCGKSK